MKHTPTKPTTQVLKVTAAKGAEARADDVSHWTPADLTLAASKLQAAGAREADNSKRVTFAPDTKEASADAAATAQPRPSPFGDEVRERVPTTTPSAEMLEAHMDRRMVRSWVGSPFPRLFLWPR